MLSLPFRNPDLEPLGFRLERLGIDIDIGIGCCCREAAWLVLIIHGLSRKDLRFGLGLTD